MQPHREVIMNIFKSLLLASAVAVVATAATAAPGGKFARADVNKDKVLTRAEACAGKTRQICKNFDAMDANRDGAVTRAEIRAFKNARRVAKGCRSDRSAR
jgi:EF hand